MQSPIPLIYHAAAYIIFTMFVSVQAKDVKKHIVKVKELYGWHFPELGILVKDDLTFIKVVKLMGK